MRFHTYCVTLRLVTFQVVNTPYLIESGSDFTSATASNWPANTMVNVTRTERTNIPMSGTFDLSYQDDDIGPITVSGKAFRIYQLDRLEFRATARYSVVSVFYVFEFIHKVDCKRYLSLIYFTLCSLFTYISMASDSMYINLAW